MSRLRGPLAVFVFSIWLAWIVFVVWATVQLIDILRTAVGS